MKRRICSLILVMAFLMSFRALAGDEGSYILQTLDEITDDALLLRVEVLSETEHVYWTEEPAVLQLLAAAGQLLLWDADEPVALMGDTEEVSLLSDELSLLSEEIWTDAMVGAAYAERNGITGEGVRVGLIDSGIRPDFGTLTGATVLAGVNYLAEEGTDARNDTADNNGHGTVVAGILASDFSGIAPGVELLPLKCFDASTSSLKGVIAATYDAVDIYHCDILNMSLGTTKDNRLLYEAVRYAYDHKVIIVGAAGNLTDGAVSTGNDAYYYPAAYHEVIGVGAVNQERSITDFSNQNDSVMVVAPGQNIRGLNRTGANYVIGKGTSFAAPFVTAAAALALSVKPTLTPLKFMSLLADTATDLGKAGYDYTYGNGLLNIGLLLSLLLEDTEYVYLNESDGSRSLSAYVPETKDGYQVLLMKYDGDGRYLGYETVTAGKGGYIRELELPEMDENAVLMIVGQLSWLPLRSTLQTEP